MAKLSFAKATKSQSRLRMALVGVSGSGKTVTALRIAKGLGKKIALIDTERGSASKYAGEFVDFDVLELDTYAPKTFIAALLAAEAAGYDVCIVDSLSHAWMGKDGALEMVDKAAKRSQSGNTFMAWRDVTPEHNALVDAILQSRMHVIVTMRAKTEYVMDPGTNGKTTPRKVGMAPVQRDGMEYEMDVVAMIDSDHNFVVTKTRCAVLDEQVFKKAGEDVAGILTTWLTDGAKRVDPVEELLADLRTVKADDAYAKLRETAIKLRPSMPVPTREFVKDALDAAAARLKRAAEDAAEAEEAERALAAQEAAEKGDVPFESATSATGSSSAAEGDVPLDSTASTPDTSEAGSTPIAAASAEAAQ